MKKLMVLIPLVLMIYLISACVPAAAPVNPTVSPVYSVTPRGNKLEATDPSKVNLSNGKPIFVEFFRFT
jgi:hypothetical protein